MKVEIKCPQLSESVSEGTLGSWKKQIGEAVARDEIIVEIETDKVVLEVRANEAGSLIEILKGEGETVVSDEVIARFDTSAKGKAAEKKAEAPAPVVAAVATPTPAHASGTIQMAAASPAAQKILEEKGIAAANVAGTGRGGRITKEDALRAEATQSRVAESASGGINLGDRIEQRVPMSRLRARIAERLIQSKNENAILTTFNEVNMGPVLALRKQYGEKFEKAHGVRLGVMGFFVKAVCAALERFPILNASVDGNDIVYHGYMDIGIAVGSPRGLVVPILRDVSNLTLADIERKVAEFGEKAREGKLSIEELTGGTFSISNGGVFGSMLSTPIINPPQSAILGIHATKDRPVVENGQIVIRPMNYLALSYDHRIIDGREAVLGLVAIKEALEDPARLVLGV
ncbi:MAG: 2-oxoglutarate dehydrogenase complex dihydrolipoyllysine-residue succinyltransferase [Zoogloeaceae bacterium]|jgi:2-oxoglutarate dehydrogenase E2 component (dihydrolipoamide succinyltransferase)|nr:2-oxoglutarate dehydrogenase complex dihydrolipoyllysine-residue succinyltransferase [Zoogloeaceae bacterium]